MEWTDSLFSFASSSSLTVNLGGTGRTTPMIKCELWTRSTRIPASSLSNGEGAQNGDRASLRDSLEEWCQQRTISVLKISPNSKLGLRISHSCQSRSPPHMPTNSQHINVLPGSSVGICDYSNCIPIKAKCRPLLLPKPRRKRCSRGNCTMPLIPNCWPNGRPPRNGAFTTIPNHPSLPNEKNCSQHSSFRTPHGSNRPFLWITEST